MKLKLFADALVHRVVASRCENGVCYCSSGPSTHAVAANPYLIGTPIGCVGAVAAGDEAATLSSGSLFPSDV